MSMMKLRKQAKLFLWIVVIAFGGWIFFDLGADLVGKRISKPWERGIIAEVDGKPIPYQAYENMLQAMYQDSMQAKGGRELTDQEETALESEVWNRIIEELQWNKAVRRRNLNLEDVTVWNLIQISPPAEIQQMEEFQTDGQFDHQKYLQAVRDPNNLAYFRQYEATLRADIPKELFRADIFHTAQISEKEAYDRFLADNRKIKVRFLALRPSEVPDSLLRFGEEDLERYYREHKDELENPMRVSLRMATFWKKPSTEDTLTAKDRLDTAYEELQDGEGFEEVAQYYSEDEFTKDQGGDLGWIRKGERTFESTLAVAETLETGKFSAPYYTPAGWEILKVEEKRRDSLHLRHILTKVRTSGMTLANLRTRSEEFAELSKSIGIEAASESMEVDIQSTDLFVPEYGYIPLFGKDEDLIEFIEDADVGEVTDVLRRPNFYIVAELEKEEPAGLPPLEEIRDRVETALEKDLREKKVRETAREIYGVVSGGGTLEEAASAAEHWTPKVEETDFFGRDEVVRGVPGITEFHGAAFALSEGEISPPIDTRYGSFLIQAQATEEPYENFATRKTEIESRLTNVEISRLWTSWSEELTEDADIEDYRNYLLY
jgi:peptidyl-prolyl cis-trans isomerase D